MPNQLTGDFIDGVIEHMNADHKRSLLDYASAFTDIDWANNATLLTIYHEGIELKCTAVDGREQTVNIAFKTPIKREQQLRGVLVAMAKDARQQLQSRT